MSHLYLFITFIIHLYLLHVLQEPLSFGLLLTDFLQHKI